MAYRINLSQLIYLLDEATVASIGSDVSAINGLIGEELLLEIYCHHLEHQRKFNGISYDHRSPQVKESLAHTIWKKLDGLVKWSDGSGLCHHMLVECKNWTGHSKGTKKLAHDCAPEEQHVVSTYHWNNLILEKGNYNKHISKVAFPVTKEVTHGSFKRLLLMWLPVSCDPSADLVTSKLICPNGYGEVEVFSASNYVRSLITSGTTHIELQLNGYSRRSGQLNLIGL